VLKANLTRNGDYASPDHQEEDRRLGSRLRAIRKERALSIQALSGRCSLSVGMLSQIERGLSQPSVRSLRLLSVALEVPISDFFAASPASESKSAPFILRKAARRTLHLNPTGVRKDSLAPEAKGSLELYNVTLRAGGTSGPEFYSHEGEKAGLVLTGTLRLWLAEEPFDLTVGDSFRFPSEVAHRFENVSRSDAVVLWVVSAHRVHP
jgi:transcriptional regulator with XRE-family HTH domain